MRAARMMMLAGGLGCALAFGASGSARAAMLLGSHVSTGVFKAAIGDSAGWAYLGEGSPKLTFTEPGVATLEMRESSYRNSFGIISAGEGRPVTELVFGADARAGATAEIAPDFGSFQFFFEAAGASKDDNIRSTDGTGSGPGAAQAGIDSFFNAASGTYALFYDDAGGGSGWKGDDNDYNDLVVTWRPIAAVSEPAAIGLLAAGLIVLAVVRARRRTAV